MTCFPECCKFPAIKGTFESSLTEADHEAWKNVSYASQYSLSECGNLTEQLCQKKTSPNMVMADGCKWLNVTNHWSLEALLQSWGVLPGYRFSLPPLPSQPWSWGTMEISHSGSTYIALAAVCLHSMSLWYMVLLARITGKDVGAATSPTFWVKGSVGQASLL